MQKASLSDLRKVADPVAKRRQFPKKVQTEVLLKSRRRCAYCYGLDGDTTQKEGQIAHIDRD
ncbi:MAG: hypothetical protein MN733_43495, partial [Nitrososphaera sp.]|nr:hypothetical protein [Nitrososphaera sp.]